MTLTEEQSRAQFSDESRIVIEETDRLLNSVAAEW